MEQAEQRLHEEGIAGQIYLLKNNTDSTGNSYGSHENYLATVLCKDPVQTRGGQAVASM